MKVESIKPKSGKWYIVFDKTGHFVKRMLIDKSQQETFSVALKVSGHFAQREETMGTPPSICSLERQLKSIGWAFDENGEVVTKG